MWLPFWLSNNIAKKTSFIFVCRFYFVINFFLFILALFILSFLFRPLLSQGERRREMKWPTICAVLKIDHSFYLLSSWDGTKDSWIADFEGPEVINATISHRFSFFFLRHVPFLSLDFPKLFKSWLLIFEIGDGFKWKMGFLSSDLQKKVWEEKQNKVKINLFDAIQDMKNNKIDKHRRVHCYLMLLTLQS